jgi:hypothetical protein
VDLLTKPKAHAKRKDLLLNGKLFVFAIICVVASATLYSLALKNYRFAPMFSVCVVSLLCWAAYGAFSHLVCKVLMGHGALKAGMAMVIQILSITSLMAVFCGFLVSFIGRGEIVILGWVFLVQLVLGFCYFSLCLGSLYGFGFFRSVIVGLFLSVVYSVLNGFLVLNSGPTLPFG